MPLSPLAPSATKQQWRSYLRATIRQQLSGELAVKPNHLRPHPASTRARISEVALDQLRSYLAANATVVSYTPLPHELDVTSFNELVQTQGAQLWVPVVNQVPAGASLSDLPVAFCSPGRRPTSLERLCPAVVLVPALAIDGGGVRLGQGGGWYDRALASLPDATLVVGCVPHWRYFSARCLPAEAHDQRVAVVATDRGWWEVSAAENACINRRWPHLNN